MTMGLIILGVFTLALFFSFGQHAFRGLGLSVWAAFLIILAFAIGIIVPSIPFGGVFYANVGGFIMPMLAEFALFYVMIKNGTVGRGIVAMLAVVAISVGLLFLMPMNNMGMIVLTAFVIGIVSGSVAFIIARNRAASVFAIFSGVMVADIIFNLVNYFAWGGGAFTLGSSVIFNSMFLAVMCCLVFAEVAVGLGKTSGGSSVSRRKLNFEASDDNDFDALVGEDDEFDSFDDELF